MRRTLLLTTLLAGLAGTAAAQVPSRDYLVGGFERQKAVLLMYVDAMPDSGMAFAPTPGVRTYAQQLEHIAQATMGITSQLLASPAATPTLPGPDTYLTNKAAMKQFIAGSFDAATAMVRSMTDADLSGQKQLFGMTRLGWEWVVGTQEHTAWTLGATVPYLRMNGVTPPQYLPF